MATCYYCMNKATSKRWVTVSYGSGGRLCVSRRGISGMSAGGGSRTAVRGVCGRCSAGLDEASDNATVAWCVLLAIAACVAVFFLAYNGTHQPIGRGGPNGAIVWEDKDAK